MHTKKVCMKVSNLQEADEVIQHFSVCVRETGNHRDSIWMMFMACYAPFTETSSGKLLPM